jgi:hypothetical protein
MRVWSRGLGRVELAADLNKVKVMYDGKSLYITGRTEPPVGWDFVVVLNSCELWPIVKAVMNKQGGKFFLKYVKLRATDRKALKENYAEATHTRTGVKPELEYAEILKAAAQDREKRALAAKRVEVKPTVV